MPSPDTGPVDARQEALTDPVPVQRRRVWCRVPSCGRELTDEISRQRGVGPEHDPEPRHTSRRFTIDQDAIPGLEDPDARQP